MKTLQRKSNMPDADLMALSTHLKSMMERDAALFLARGISEADRIVFDSVAGEFKTFPLDIDYRGKVREATEERQKVRSNVTKSIQRISGYFEQMYGLESAEYEQLQIKNLKNLSDKDYLFAGRNVVSVAFDQLSELSSIGLTDTEINSLASEMDDLESKVFAVAEMKKQRKEKRLERIVLANKLYDLIVQYCMIGKLIWEDSDPVRFKGYLIYRGRSKKYRKASEKKLKA